MRKVFLVLLLSVVAFTAWAGSPLQELMYKYEDVRGVRHIVAQGRVMNVVRPMLNKYPIAPLAPKVEEMSLIKMANVSPDIKRQFIKDLDVALLPYLSTGKSQMPNGLVDTYVHQCEDGIVDELVVFNPELMVLYVMKGKFTPEELQKIPKNP